MSIDSAIINLQVDEVRSMLSTNPLIDWDNVLLKLYDNPNIDKCIEILSMFNFSDSQFRRSSTKLIMDQVAVIDKYPVLQYLASRVLRMAYNIGGMTI